MIKFYQTQWFNINFCDFIKVNSKEIADADFYTNFYDEFFRRYKSWTDLPLSWILEKKEIAKFIYDVFLKHNLNQNFKTLSIGSGLGAVEIEIRNLGYSKIEVQETNESAFKWIQKELPSDQILIGDLHKVTIGKKYDLIYICAVDYCFDSGEIELFIKVIHSLLTDSGTFLLVSASRYQNSFYYHIKRILSAIKRILYNKSKGQFWGYMRTKEDYNELMKECGFFNIKDGFIMNRHYYITGENN